MTTVMPQQAAPARQYRRVPWSPRAWSQALYLAGGIPAQLLALACVLIPWWSLTRPSWPRQRVPAGVVIPPQPAGPARLSLPGLLAMVRSEATWRQVRYPLLVAPAL